MRLRSPSSAAVATNLRCPSRRATPTRTPASICWRRPSPLRARSSTSTLAGARSSATAWPSRRAEWSKPSRPPSKSHTSSGKSASRPGRSASSWVAAPRSSAT
uniref:(northern house mosquito) hypothetical protein n=1 Tax=Culex pipiens TaxID=7175 RepID=A0A8D8IXQ7_CULPI